MYLRDLSGSGLHLSKRFLHKEKFKHAFIDSYIMDLKCIEGQTIKFWTICWQSYLPVPWRFFTHSCLWLCYVHDSMLYIFIQLLMKCIKCIPFTSIQYKSSIYIKIIDSVVFYCFEGSLSTMSIQCLHLHDALKTKHSAGLCQHTYILEIIKIFRVCSW